MQKKPALKQVLIAFVLLGLAAACLPTAKRGPANEAVYPTWTPVFAPTDAPLVIESEKISFFGDTPLLVFAYGAGATSSSVEIVNLTTADQYDDALLEDLPQNDWSRPLLKADKEVLFQVQDRLFVLIPGKEGRAIELPYDPADPALCNWYHAETLFCLNKTLSQGFTLDADLQVQPLQLPPLPSGLSAEDFYPAYALSDARLRTVVQRAIVEGGKSRLLVRELSLETRQLTETYFPLEIDFTLELSALEGWQPGNGANSNLPDAFKRSEAEVRLIGVTEDLEKAYFQSAFVSEKNEKRLYNETFDLNTGLGGPTATRTREPDPKNHFHRNFLLWPRQSDHTSRELGWPGLLDLASGFSVYDFAGWIAVDDPFIRIWPYGEHWLIGSSKEIHYTQTNGLIIQNLKIPPEIQAKYGDGLRYLLTQNASDQP